MAKERFGFFSLYKVYSICYNSKYTEIHFCGGRQKMITIKDVASRAKVSPSTASRALRRIGYISNETHESVFRAAAELGYIANSTAQQLKKNTTKTVGFIISDSNNEYYFSILSDIQKMLNENGMNLVIAFSSENPVDEETCFRSLIASRASAIFFTPTSKQNAEIIRVAKKNGIKVVQLFRNIYEDLDTIINDDESGCKQAAEKLLELGCRRLLLVDVEYRYLESGKVRPDRSTGFLQAFKDSDAVYKILRFPLIDYDTAVLSEAIDEFSPDGIITATNVAGLEVLSHIMRKKLSKVRFITFDDNRWLQFFSISAIRQNSTLLADAIKSVICSQESGVRKVSIPQTLSLRNDCLADSLKDIKI